ncbi:probable E3 ubiquitin-protein ligase bre1 [Anopheles gambiae]|uniref:probable E3 ubiquitin-protein ligase bre1 n=1 Tax=Anopheles gambiae TaxID=7165 RepID=UPI002AC92568|nr:probable E3 ubiquitin-protein ligase bre1 [Anopheles gambiae]
MFVTHHQNFNTLISNKFPVLLAPPTADVQAIMSYLTKCPWRSSMNPKQEQETPVCSTHKQNQLEPQQENEQQQQQKEKQQQQQKEKRQQQQKEAQQQQDLQKNSHEQFQTVLVETQFEEQYQRDPSTNVSTSNVSMTGSHLQYLPRSRCNSLDDYLHNHSFDETLSIPISTPAPNDNSKAIPTTTSTTTATTSAKQKSKKKISSLERKLDLLNTKLDYIIDVLHEKSGHSEPVSEFDFEAIQDQKQLEDFESQLGESNGIFKQKILTELRSSLKLGNSKYQIHQALDLLFSRQFLAKMTWSGRSKTEQKIPFSSYTNIKKIFLEIAETKFVKPAERFVFDYIGQKLRHASSRLNLSGARASTSHNFKPKH